MLFIIMDNEKNDFLLFVFDDDWFIELPDLDKLLYFLGCDGKRYLKYNQSPISIKYKKRVCKKALFLNDSSFIFQRSVHIFTIYYFISQFLFLLH